MSEQGQAQALSPEMDKVVAELREKFVKKDKVVALANDDQEAFANLVLSFGDNVKDWTDGADNKVFTGLALTKSENGRIAFIPLASEEEVFADPIVRKALLRIYYNKVVNAATEDDATAAQFLTVAGCFKQKFDLDAFKFLAKPFTKFLREQGLSGVTNMSLRQSFASAAFAKTQFPRTTDEQWVKILGMAKAIASKNGYETSIYDHWEATRAVQTADTSILNLDFAKLHFGDDSEADDGEENATAPAPEPAKQ